MSTYNSLNLSIYFCKDWQFKNGVREVIQNTIDCAVEYITFKHTSDAFKSMGKRSDEVEMDGMCRRGSQ